MYVSKQVDTRVLFLIETTYRSVRVGIEQEPTCPDLNLHLLRVDSGPEDN